MAVSQYDLCAKVLKRLDDADILKDVVLVGSWCTMFYKDFFGENYISSITTRDIDLLFPHPSTIKARVDIAELLKDLGFVIDFTGSQGYIRLVHPLLIVEFLVPERGKCIDKPYKLTQLGVNAQALRFLDFLSQNTITSKIGATTVTLPHPVNFALHKLLIINRRNLQYKKDKDKDAATKILNALIDSGQVDTVKKVFLSMPLKWQNSIKNQLGDITDKKIRDNLES